jgi:hypothetical protein
MNIYGKKTGADIPWSGNILLDKGWNFTTKNATVTRIKTAANRDRRQQKSPGKTGAPRGRPTEVRYIFSG